MIFVYLKYVIQCQTISYNYYWYLPKDPKQSEIKSILEIIKNLATTNKQEQY